MNGETSSSIKTRSEQQNCKKRIKYWLLSFWRYISKNGPKIDKYKTSINDLKSEEINNWKYSRLILSYDILSVKRIIRLREKAIQQKPQESLGVKHNINQNCTTMKTTKLEPGYIKPKEDTSMIKRIGSKDSLNISGEIIDEKSAIYSSFKPSGSFQSFVDSPVISLTKKTSEVEKSLFSQGSLSESPKRKLPPIPVDNYTTLIKKERPLHSTKKKLCSEKASNNQLGSRVSKEGLYVESKFNEGNFKNCSPKESIHSEYDKVGTMTAKERNKRFLKSLPYEDSSNVDSNINHRPNTLIPSEYELLFLSEEDSVRFYRMQNSRRSTARNSIRKSDVSKSS